MNRTVHIKEVGIYQCNKFNLYTLLDNFVQNQYQYGIVTNQYGDVVGYFTSKELLQHCHQIGLIHVEDSETLSLFIKILLKNFEMIEDLSKINFSNNTDLYILKKGKAIIGVIDKEIYLEYVVEKQQYELHHFKTMFNAVPSGIIAVNIEGTITMMNPAAEKFSGVKKEKAIGQFINDVVPPDGLLRVLQTGQGHVEKYKVRKWWYVSHREPIFDGKRLVGAVGVFEDISKMEMLSNELESFKQLVKENEMLMETSNYGVAIMDVNGNIIRQNRMFHQLYLTIINETKQRMQFFQAIQQVVEQQTIDHQEEICTKKGLIYQFQFIPLFEEERLTNIIIRAIDMTKEKEKDKKREQFQVTMTNLFRLNSVNEFIHLDGEMEEIVNKIPKIAKVSAPILIKGEMGTGRSLLAKQIILQSERKNALFIEIDSFDKSVTELSRIVLELENILQVATGGTIYFKNIDYLPLSLQQQLADFLIQQSNGKYYKRTSKRNDVRFIASLSNTVTFEGSNVFNEKLYYFLNAITLQIPSLKKREEDVRLIIQQFIECLNEKYGTKCLITHDACEFLANGNWKRNLIDIQQILEQYICTWPNNRIDREQLILFLNNRQLDLYKPVIVNKIIPLKQAVAEVEKELIHLVSTQNISYRKIAKILGVNPSTIIRKVKNLNSKETGFHLQEHD